MKTAGFQIVQILLTVIGAVALAVIGVELAFTGQNGASKAFGWIVILLLGVGLVGAMRKRKKRS